jgi:hypothetical protein
MARQEEQSGEPKSFRKTPGEIPRGSGVCAATLRHTRSLSVNLCVDTQSKGRKEWPVAVPPCLPRSETPRHKQVRPLSTAGGRSSARLPPVGSELFPAKPVRRELDAPRSGLQHPNLQRRVGDRDGDGAECQHRFQDVIFHVRAWRRDRTIRLMSDRLSSLKTGCRGKLKRGKPERQTSHGRSLAPATHSTKITRARKRRG